MTPESEYQKALITNWKRFRDTGYIVSDDGRVSGTKNGKMLSQSIRRGYPSVCISVDNKKLNLVVHRMVLEVFKGVAPNKDSYGMHLDNDKKHNHILNLSWGNNSENQKHSYRHGRITPFVKWNKSQASKICGKGHGKGGFGRCKICAKAYNAQWLTKRKSMTETT